MISKIITSSVKASSNISDILRSGFFKDGFTSIKGVTKNGEKIFKSTSNDMSHNVYAFLKDNKVTRFVYRTNHSRDQVAKAKGTLGSGDHFSSGYSIYNSSGMEIKNVGHRDYLGQGQVFDVGVRRYLNDGLEECRSSLTKFSPDLKTITYFEQWG